MRRKSLATDQNSLVLTPHLGGCICAICGKARDAVLRELAAAVRDLKQRVTELESSTAIARRLTESDR